MTGQPRVIIAVFVLAMAAMATAPLLTENAYMIHLLSLAGIYSIVAMGLNLVFGYTGQISLGHAAYFAIGAYTSAILTSTFQLPFEIGVLAALILSVLLGFLVGTPSLKLEGAYLAMATIGFGEIVKMLLVNWEGLTGGPAGISRLPHPTLLGTTFSSPAMKLYLIIGFTCIAFVLYYNLIRSHYGTRFVAVRDSSKAAAAMGIDVKRVKICAFTVSTGFAGVAGSLYAHLNRYLAPDAFTLGESINFLIIVVVGGMGTVLGPFLGAGLIVYLREILQSFKDYNMLIYGLLLMVLMVFMPRGLIGSGRALYARLTNLRKR